MERGEVFTRGQPSMTDPESFPAFSAREKAPFMSSQPVHAIVGRTLRHWTIDSREFVGESQQAAPAFPYSELPDSGQFHLIAQKLARIKTELARRVS